MGILLQYYVSKEPLLREVPPTVKILLNLLAKSLLLQKLPRIYLLYVHPTRNRHYSLMS